MKPVLVLRHVAHEGLGSIADALARRAVPYSIVDLYAQPLDKFAPLDWSGLIVLGGPMNVDETEQYPFLADEVHWLAQAVSAELPVMGVCLGSQLLAKALGARVYANRVKEIGWDEIELLPVAADDLLFRGITSPVNVFHWHGDTFDLPTGVVQLARSAHCEQQAFRFGTAAFGLQFHLEITPAMIDDWLCQEQNCGELAALDYVDPATIRRQTPANSPRLESVAATVFDRFAELCCRRDS